MARRALRLLLALAAGYGSALVATPALRRHPRPAHSTRHAVCCSEPLEAALEGWVASRRILGSAMAFVATTRTDTMSPYAGPPLKVVPILLMLKLTLLFGGNSTYARRVATGLALSAVGDLCLELEGRPALARLPNPKSRSASAPPSAPPRTPSCSRASGCARRHSERSRLEQRSCPRSSGSARRWLCSARRFSSPPTSSSPTTTATATAVT